MKTLFIFLLMIFSTVTYAKKEYEIKCKNLSGNVFNVRVALGNNVEQACPLIINTKDNNRQECKDCYLTLYKYDDSRRNDDFDCFYKNHLIELNCEKQN